MSVADQYPARTDTNGRTWWRPVRPAGTDLSQWGWTSDPSQAHPDYDAAPCLTCGAAIAFLSERVGWSGGWLHYAETDDGHPARPATLVDLVVAREAPVVAKAAERAEAFGDAWAQVFELAGGGRAIVPVDPAPVEPLGELGDEWVQLGYVDETQGGLW